MKSGRAGTDWPVVPDLAVSVGAADPGTGVGTLVVETGKVPGALGVTETFAASA